MGYHDLSECSLTPDERVEEAKRLAQMIPELQELENLTRNELSIVEKFLDPADSTCSVKQLFWLRDIKDKYL